jgi:hypothetical protein
MHSPQGYLELATILQMWPKLPASERAAVLAIVRALVERATKADVYGARS